MLRVALRPRWIVMHVLILVVVSLFAVAGFWQVSRLSERRAYNRSIERALAAEPIDLNSDTPDDDTRRRAVAMGRYDIKREIVLLNRSLNEAAGNHVLTPLRLSNGTAVLVDRGWVPPELDTPPLDRAAPPTGRVRVHGLLMPAEPKRPLSPDDPPTGTLTIVRRINPSRVEKQLPYKLLDPYLLLDKQSPVSGELPRRVPTPELTQGSHLSYAVQWFVFIPIALVVYTALLRREARKRTS